MKTNLYNLEFHAQSRPHSWKVIERSHAEYGQVEGTVDSIG